MKFSLFTESKSAEVISLFKAVFSTSEGETEGQIIADFVAKLIATTPAKDLLGCVAEESGRVLGCIFFSRFTVPVDKVAFILSPVAVSTARQGRGIGQDLIHYGLDHLKSLGVDLVFTYGDPAFYSKSGFEQIGEDIVEAPYPLSQPIGWLGQSLDGSKILAMPGPTRCVEALNDSSLW